MQSETQWEAHLPEAAHEFDFFDVTSDVKSDFR
jgi:hypothetical protein